MTKLLVLALCVYLVMSMSVKERLERSEALKESAESQVPSCDSSLSGNNICDKNCNLDMFNYDGGDCCEPQWVGDGDCDLVCYFVQHNFDGGDCY